MRLKRISRAPVSFFWNGRRIDGHEGDSVAAALYGAGVHITGWSRKFHRPLGYSGPIIAGVLARVDGVPNVRLDQTVVIPGMKVEMQNCWPSPRLNLFKAARLIPRHWIKGGFEHTNLVPSGTSLFQFWERFLGCVAGVGDPSSQTGSRSAIPGAAYEAEYVIVGAGPVGCRAANDLAEGGRDVLLVSRGQQRCSTASAAGAPTVSLQAQVRTLLGVDVFGAYRDGTVLLAAPTSAREGACVIRAKYVVTATGSRAVPPLVPGAWLPGVLDENAAVDLAHTYGVPPGESVVVVGDGKQQRVAERLIALGVKVTGVYPVGQLRRVLGFNQIRGIVLDEVGKVRCDALVFAGPGVSDSALSFQSSASGQLQLQRSNPRFTVARSGDEVLRRPDVPVPVCNKTLICPCMDVSTRDVAALIDAGEQDLEVIKRLTSCGMGPCQGNPCWHSLRAFVSQQTGLDFAELPLPTQRPPRRAITVAQAAGLTGLVEPLK
jgi:NADPH-dependent 2,4-dienoyl-CoA reductase/sulfur reductase-like enzyme